ncbi:DUF1616 domain-containing protein [Natronolimnobius sp. AArcel1]|uniref:DUF1616 domain-containing protein n=1 Tax=Natronolimnobius sp. AArcel1 TaxID=1679093 RepID=UPI0013EA14E6|nr:DUF1616 domain-containing protein [Natronolimnobius sp. AArcel1]NGM71235.1 DUF1616 domain-containing protein [Natronolimnobius sp. AArcel1]
MSFPTAAQTRLGRVREYPVDLAVVSLVAVLGYLLIASVPAESPLRLLVAFPLALFLPGYALTSFLFPAAERPAREAATTVVERRPRGINTVERLGLSFVLSLSILPLVVLALPVTQWGLGAGPIAAVLAGLTVVAAQLGALRRIRTPAAERFTVSFTAAFAGLRDDDSAVATFSSVILVVAVAVAAGALLVGFLFPAAGGGFTELGLYTEDDDGDLVAGEIPDEIEPGESVPVTLAVENHEGEHAEYTLVVQEQGIEDDEVVDRTELRTIDGSISDGSTGLGEREITPTAADDETVRISVLLYDDGDVPDEPTNENADEDAYFWVTVTEDAADDDE